jgi:hypothetical protein
VFLDRLPGWLSGIGVEANYTYLDSKNPGRSLLRHQWRGA